jgi:hypothetical protein
MDKDDIDRRATEFAAALEGPLGPMPLERVVRQHVELFNDLRQAGASWRQIAALMVRHGVRRKDGESVDSTQWASMVSRAGRLLYPLEANVSTPSPINPVQALPTAAPSAPISDSGRNRAEIRKRMQSSRATRTD